MAGLASRNDLPLLRSGDLSDEMLADVARVAARHGREQTGHVRPVERVRRGAAAAARRPVRIRRRPDHQVAEAHHQPRPSPGAADQPTRARPTPQRRSDAPTEHRGSGCTDHEIYTTQALLDAEARLLDAGRSLDGPRPSGAVAITRPACRIGTGRQLSAEQRLAVEQITTSGRVLDVLVGPAGTGKSTTMAGLRTAWEHRTAPGR